MKNIKKKQIKKENVNQCNFKKFGLGDDVCVMRMCTVFVVSSDSGL